MNNFLSIPLKPKIRKNVSICLITLGFAYLVCGNLMFFAIFTVSLLGTTALSAVIELLFKIKIDFKYSLIFALGITMCLSYQDSAHSATLFQALEDAVKEIVSSSGSDGVDEEGITNFFIFIRVIVILGLATLMAGAAWISRQGNDPSTLITVFAIALFTVLGIQIISQTIL